MASPPEKLLADLARAFPRQPVTPETLLVYLQNLADVPADALESAVRMLIRTSEFFPTIRAIRERVAEDVLALPGEAAALGQVEARVAWGRRSSEEQGAAPYVHPLVREALDHVGGFWAFKETDKPSVVRGQFLSYYRELRAAAIRDVQVSGSAALETGAGAARALGSGNAGRQPSTVVA